MFVGLQVWGFRLRALRSITYLSQDVSMW